MAGVRSTIVLLSLQVLLVSSETVLLNPQLAWRFSTTSLLCSRIGLLGSRTVLLSTATGAVCVVSSTGTVHSTSVSSVESSFSAFFSSTIGSKSTSLEGVSATCVSVFAGVAGASSAVCSAASRAVSGVLSLSVTVVKWANGRLTSSRKVPSGVKLILLCPLIWKRSPVLMFTLSRSLTSTNLKVPKPVTLTKLSFSRPSSVNSKKVRTKSSACSGDSDSRSAKRADRS